MTFADHTFHNKYLCDEIFSHTKKDYQYCNIKNGTIVAEHGLLKLLQLKAGFENNLQFTSSVVGLAAVKGHLPVIQWLHANCIKGWTVWVMNLAATYGHLDIVKWLHENRSEGCTELAMDGAAEQGHLAVLKWLHENRGESCTHYAMNWAVEHKHQHVVEWLKENIVAFNGYFNLAI